MITSGLAVYGLTVPPVAPIQYTVQQPAPNAAIVQQLRGAPAGLFPGDEDAVMWESPTSQVCAHAASEGLLGVRELIEGG